jgi:hypothetical protein
MKRLRVLLLVMSTLSLITAAAATGLAGWAAAVESPALTGIVSDAVRRVVAGPRAKPLSADELAVTVVDLAEPATPRFGSHRGAEPIYPASVVKLFYLAAAHRWLEDGRLEDTAELRRALRDMIVDSSNEATHYVLDLLTGTTSGPELTPDALRAWQEQRNAVNRHFVALGYPATLNANKKPWCEGPYGRETQAIAAFSPQRNFLTADATARLLCEIALDRAVTPERCRQMRALLARDFTAAATPEDQTHGFVGDALAPGAKLWSKAGWTSQTRHDVALIELPGGRRVVLAIYTVNHAPDEKLVPALAREVLAKLPR